MQNEKLLVSNFVKHKNNNKSASTFLLYIYTCTVCINAYNFIGRFV